MSYNFSACPRTTKFLLASNFLEARVGGARRVRITGERCAESVSNVFALVHSLLWKAKKLFRMAIKSVRLFIL